MIRNRTPLLICWANFSTARARNGKAMPSERYGLSWCNFDFFSQLSTAPSPTTHHFNHHSLSNHAPFSNSEGLYFCIFLHRRDDFKGGSRRVLRTIVNYPHAPYIIPPVDRSFPHGSMFIWRRWTIEDACQYSVHAVRYREEDYVEATWTRARISLDRSVSSCIIIWVGVY